MCMLDLLDYNGYPEVLTLSLCQVYIQTLKIKRIKYQIKHMNVFELRITRHLKY